MQRVKAHEISTRTFFRLISGFGNVRNPDSEADTGNVTDHQFVLGGINVCLKINRGIRC